MRRLALCLLAGSVSAVVPACLGCDDIACGGGFEWTARAADDSALPAGAYALTITLEDDVFEATCTIEASAGASQCGAASHLEGDVAYTLHVTIVPVDPADEAAPVAGLSLFAVDTSGSASDGSRSESRGPTSVAVAIARADTIFVDEHYDVDYERNEEFRGDPRCGFCDSYESRTATWDPSALDDG